MVLKMDSAANQDQALLLHNLVPGAEEGAATASFAVLATPQQTPGCLLYISNTGSSMSCHLERRGQREGPGPAAIGCHSFSWSGDSRVCDDILDPKEHHHTHQIGCMYVGDVGQR